MAAAVRREARSRHEGISESGPRGAPAKCSLTRTGLHPPRPPSRSLVRQVVDEERRFFITKLSVTLRGARPRALRGAARRGKRTGEADRVLPAGHKSAEPVKAGRPGTSDPDYGLASVSVMERETEPTADAPSRGASPMRKWARRSKDLWSAGSLLRDANRGCPSDFGHQPSGKPARPEGQIPHGVKSAPKTDERSSTEPENPFLAPGPRRVRMIEATDDREDGGRSLRSSPRTGKPSTWRRKAVATECRQEAG